MNVSFKDSTDEWKEVSPEQAKSVTDLKEYVIGGQKYVVDGRNVVLDYSVHEKEIADILAKKYGRSVQMVPRVAGNFLGISTPDYIIGGEKWDLKELKSSKADGIRNAIHKKEKQADHFIIDISKNESSIESIMKQAENVFEASNTRFVDGIIIIKDGEILKVFKRK